MLLSEVTHRMTKEAIVKYAITEEMLANFADKRALRKYINQCSVRVCHDAKDYHKLKYNTDMTYTNNMRETKRNEGREKALLKKLANV